jgi:hypothetical protein
MKWCTITFFMLVLPSLLLAQKTLLIHDELDKNAEKLKVKMGASLGNNLWKLKFGEYAVMRGKSGWGKSSSKSNLFGTKSETKTTSKFSFELANGKKDLVNVNAETNVFIKEKNAYQLFPNFALGEDEVLQAENNFAAFMHVNGDTSMTWGLFLNETGGTEATNMTEGYLTNRDRKIAVKWVSSDEGDKKQMLPAMGYEFTENGKPLSAVQYYGGGMLGMNKIIVWLHPDNEEDTKLILAAAMTAILQIKAGDPDRD